jgi:hypothetical protein
MMEVIRRFVEHHGWGFDAYMALERALMRRYIARGGSALDFCDRLAPAFRRRFAPVLLEARQERLDS